MRNSVKVIFKNNYLSFLFLGILVIITYFNILPNGLFFDDEELIYKNQYVSNLSLLPIFTQNMVAGAGKVSNMYRPVLMISFAVDHMFWGNNPLGYHMTSIILHFLNSALVYLLIFRIFGKKITAFVTASLFAVHPGISEAVIYASGRTDPLYTLFFLLSLYLYIRYLEKSEKSYFYFLSVFFFLLSLLSKETAIVLPFILLAVNLVKPRQKSGSYIRLIVPFLTCVLIYIFLRLTVLNFSNTLNFYSYSNIYSSSIVVRLLTFTGVFFEYLKILFFPKELVVARDPAIITGILNRQVPLFLLLNLSLFALSFFAWRKGKGIFLFAFLWFFITILPASGIIPINNIITEHYLYLPSIAFFLLSGYLIDILFVSSFAPTLENNTGDASPSTLLRVKEGQVYTELAEVTRIKNNAKLVFDKHRNQFQKSLGSLIYLTLIILLAYRTFLRTYDWRDAVTFYNVSLKQSPWHVPMKHNLAMAYSEKGELDKAISMYQEIIDKSDTYPNTHHNLANIYRDQGKIKEAEEEYLKAISMDKSFVFSYYSLLDLYQKSGQKEKYDRLLIEVNGLKKLY